MSQRARIITTATLVLILIASGCVTGADDPFAPAIEDPGARARAAEQERRLMPDTPYASAPLAQWATPATPPPQWPEEADFRATYEQGLRPYSIIECEEARLELGEAWVARGYAARHDLGAAMLAEGDGEQIEVLAALHGQDARYILGELRFAPTPELLPAKGGARYGGAQGEGALVCEGLVRHTPQALDARVWGAHAYVHTLLAPSEDLYLEREPEERSKAERERIYARLNALEDEPRLSYEDALWLVEEEPAEAERFWGRALEAAEARGDVALTYDIYRRYKPMGRCSRDRRPVRVKRQFASFCSKQGKLSCHLRLMTELMAYRGMSRVSDMWINGKPVTYDSYLAALDPLVEAAAYFPGLLLDYPGTSRRAQIAPHFYALAARGPEFVVYEPMTREEMASRSPSTAEVHAEMLKQILSSGGLDPWNAHRFALTLTYLQRQGGTSLADIRAEMAQLQTVPALTMAMLGPLAQQDE